MDSDKALWTERRNSDLLTEKQTDGVKELGPTYQTQKLTANVDLYKNRIAHVVMLCCQLSSYVSILLL